MSDYCNKLPKLNLKQTNAYQNFRNSLESKLSQVTIKNRNFLDDNVLQKKFYLTQPQISSQFQSLQKNIERMKRQRFSPVNNSKVQYSTRFKFYNSPRKDNNKEQERIKEKQQIEKNKITQNKSQSKECSLDKIRGENEEKVQNLHEDSSQNFDDFQKERFENFKKVLEHCWNLEKKIRSMNSDQNILEKQNELIQLEQSKNLNTIEHLKKEKNQMILSINGMQKDYDQIKDELKTMEKNLNQTLFVNKNLISENQQLLRIVNQQQISETSDKVMCNKLFEKYIENRKIDDNNENSFSIQEFNQENSLQKQIKNLQNTIQFLLRNQKLEKHDQAIFQDIQKNLQNIQIIKDQSLDKSKLSLQEYSFVEGKYCLQQAIESLDNLQKNQKNLKIQSGKEILQNLRVTQQYFQKHEKYQQKIQKEDSSQEKRNPLQLELNNKFRQFFDNNDLNYDESGLSKDINQQNIQFLDYMISAIDTGVEEDKQSMRKNTANSLSLKHRRFTPQNINTNRSNNLPRSRNQRQNVEGQNVQETLSISNEEKTLRITEDDYFKLKVLLEDKKKSINQQKKLQQEQLTKINELEKQLRNEIQKNDNYQRNINNQEIEMNRNKEQLTEIQGYCEELEDKIQSQQNLTKEIEKLRIQNQRLQEDLNSNQIINDRDNMMKQEFVKLQQHHRSLQNQLKEIQDKHQKQIQKQEQNNLALNDNLNTLKIQNDQLKTELEIKSLEFHNLQQQLDNIQNKDEPQQNRIESGSLSDNMQILQPDSNNDIITRSYQILKSQRSNNKSFYSLQQYQNNNQQVNFFNEEDSQMQDNLKKYLDIELLRIKNQLIKEHDIKIRQLNSQIIQLQKEINNKTNQQANLQSILQRLQSEKQQIIQKYDEKVQENENLRIQFQKLKIKNYQLEQTKVQNTEFLAKIQKLEKQIELLKQKEESEEDEENDSDVYSEDDDDSIFKDQQAENLKNKSQEIVEKIEPQVNFEEKMKQIYKQNDIFSQLIRNTKELIQKSIKPNEQQNSKEIKIEQIIRLEEYERINEDQKKELESLDKNIRSKEEKKQQKIETIKKINQMFNNLINERNKIFEELAQQKKQKCEILKNREQNINDKKLQEELTQELQKIDQELQTQDYCLKEYEEEIQQLKEYWNQNLKQNQILDQEISKLKNKNAKLIKNYDYDLQVLIDQVKNIHKEQQKSTKNNQL